MFYCLYADGEEIESDLTKEEAIKLECEILDEDPEAMVSLEPMGDEEDGGVEEEDDFEDDEEELEDEEEDE